MEIAELAGLAREYEKPLYAFCRRLAGNAPDAEDLFQETFLTAAERCGRLNADRNVKSYLFGVAARLWKNKRAKDARRARLAPWAALTDQDADKGEAPDALLIRGEEEGLIRAAAAELPDKLRVALYMRYASDLSVEEIARALGVPQGTVKSRLHKARAEIKRQMEGEMACEVRTV